jgi:cardiolipin synthase
MIQVKGPAASLLEQDFGRAWACGGFLGDIEGFFHLFKKHEKVSGSGGYPLRILYTRPGDSEIRKTQLEAIARAREYIFIQNPYFTDDAILHALIRAKRRGVDVRIVLPVTVNNSAIERSNVLAANRMLKSGIRVYILPYSSHVKAAVYDGWACMGSANFDKLSLRINYETDLATSHPQAVRVLVKRLFEEDFDRAAELKEQLPERSRDFLMEILADQL